METAQVSPKIAPREPQGSLPRASGSLLGSLGVFLGVLGRSWDRLGSLRPFLGSKSAQNSTTRAPYNPRHWISKNLEKPMLGALSGLFRGSFGALSGFLWSSFGVPWSRLGLSWGSLGLSWSSLEVSSGSHGGQNLSLRA